MAESSRSIRPANATVSGVIALYRMTLAQSWFSAMLVSFLWTGLLARPLLALDPEGDVLRVAAQLQESLFAPSFGYALLAVTAGLAVDVWSKILGTPEQPVKFAGTIAVF